MHKDNQIFIDACFMKPVNRTPIWIMRQAGRYLPEYRNIRSKNSFHEMMHTPDLMAEVTLLPMNRFDLDASIMFSDILVVPESIGMKFELVPKVGPVFKTSISSSRDIEKLNFDHSYFKNIYNGIKIIRNTLDKTKSLIGFAGTPWTTACYMVEGKPSKDYMKIRSLMYNDYESFDLLMRKITDATISYIREQINSGVNAVQIFDSNGVYISKKNFIKYSLPYIKEIINFINSQNIPSIYYAKGLCDSPDLIMQTNSNVLGIDWSVELSKVKSATKGLVALQGNLDPAILLCPNNVIKSETEKVLQSFGKGSGHIFNLGHGITPNVRPESVEYLVQQVREMSSKNYE